MNKQLSYMLENRCPNCNQQLYAQLVTADNDSTSQHWIIRCSDFFLLALIASPQTCEYIYPELFLDEDKMAATFKIAENQIENFDEILLNLDASYEVEDVDLP